MKKWSEICPGSSREKELAFLAWRGVRGFVYFLMSLEIRLMMMSLMSVMYMQNSTRREKRAGKRKGGWLVGYLVGRACVVVVWKQRV